MTIRRQPRFRPRALPLALLILLALTGCVPDQDYGPLVTEFQRSSAMLAQSFQTLLANANLIEYEHYIDTQTFDHHELAPAEIDSRSVITPEELKLRSDAILALSQYTSALATLAEGKQEAKITADADAASTSFSTLATDAQTMASSHHLITATADYSSPVSAAASAAGAILGLIARHRSREAIRQSIEKNDPALNALFDLLASESRSIYQRQRSTQSAQGVLLFNAYNNEVAQPSPDKDYVLELSERIKQFRRNQALVAQADPEPAILAFKRSHDALIAVILAPKSARPQSMAQLESSVRAFAAEVQSLADGAQGNPKRTTP